MKGQELINLVDAILAFTKEGRIVDWSERIALLAKDLELPIHAMKWDGSPQTVAYRLVDAAENWEKIEELCRKVGV